MIFWKDKLRASSIHLGISALVVILSAGFVFILWYPYPYREISSGGDIFTLIAIVDLILGPLITLIVFNKRKPKVELLRDLSVIAVIQIFALAYGIWTMAVARPVHLVFEIDRFRVVHAIEIEPTLLQYAPRVAMSLPWSGPTLLALRPFKDENERMEATLAALQGVSLASRPDLWRPYEEATTDVLKEAKPGMQLVTRFSARAAEIEQVLRTIDRKPSSVVYLPLVGRKSFWTVFLDPVTAKVLTTMPLDSF